MGSAYWQAIRRHAEWSGAVRDWRLDNGVEWRELQAARRELWEASGHAARS